MDKMVDHADSDTSSDHDGETETVSEVGVLGLDLPSESMCSNHIEGTIGSSSQSNLRAFFIGMGFSPTLVDKVIGEYGEDNVDLLLETLIACSAHKKSSSESSDSLDGLFGDCKDGDSPEFLSDRQPIEDLNVPTDINQEKRASLLMMNFSVDEVEFAIDKLGEDAPVSDLVDLIIAAQIAESSGKDIGDTSHVEEAMNEEITNETLFGTMDKTLRLLEMGFSDHEISSALEKLGSEVPLGELADSIFANQIASTCVEKDKVPSSSRVHYSHRENEWSLKGRTTEKSMKRHYSGALIEESKASSSGAIHHLVDFDCDKSYKWKKPKEEQTDDSTTFLGHTWREEKPFEPNITSCHNGLHPFGKEQVHRVQDHNWPERSQQSIRRVVARAPYFFYGNVADVSQASWSKMSQFLYALQPEFVNTQYFSALCRKEGYIHNLPTENRHHIIPRPPMTIEDVIPHTKKCWPSWDTRKQLSCINSETKGISQLCERLGKMLIESRGILSTEQQRDMLHHCKTLNLVWVGQNKLSPMEAEHLEQILGYPLHHTEVPGYSLLDRLRSLKHCFQTDTLGYHLSVLKNIFPGGIKLLSLYSGIGGAEVALHRLGIHLKVVVSVEASEMKQQILRRWWRNSGQTGELVHMDDIQKLTSSKLESLIKDFGGFDFVICQNPCSSVGDSKMVADGDTIARFDFQLFCEFVRVVQRVRGTMERK